jgi:uncharacterized protein (DUF39 family)
MSITVAARLASPDWIGRAVMFGSAGVSLATVAGVPIGVALSEAVAATSLRHPDPPLPRANAETASMDRELFVCPSGIMML